MTKTYTTQKPIHGIIRKLDREKHRLDTDDELFYHFLKNRLDSLLRQPQMDSILKITTYSKAWRTPLM